MEIKSQSYPNEVKITPHGSIFNFIKNFSINFNIYYILNIIINQ